MIVYPVSLDGSHCCQAVDGFIDRPPSGDGGYAVSLDRSHRCQTVDDFIDGPPSGDGGYERTIWWLRVHHLAMVATWGAN